MASHGHRPHLRLVLLGAAALAVLGLAAPAARAVEPLPPDKVAQEIAERYGVEVLRVSPLEIDGKQAYAVVVMNPGGNFNEAYQVNTLIVDPATGALVPQFRHHPAGYDLPGRVGRAPPVHDIGPAIRRMTYPER